MSDPLNGALWRCDQGDLLPWLASLPEQSVDLVFGSPPYSQARLYLEDDQNLGIARNAEQWAAWMVDVFRASLRVCRGLVAFVVEGQTRDYRWDAAPALLLADLHRAGIHLRKPPIYRRVGIPGSGGPDWLRNDWEFIVCATNGGKLPWSDNTAMGHPPKWAPGGEMSHRTEDGSRVNGRNKWGIQGGSGMRRANGKRRTHGKPPAVEADVVGEEEAAQLFEGADPLPGEPDPWHKHGRGNSIGGRKANDEIRRGTLVSADGRKKQPVSRTDHESDGKVRKRLGRGKSPAGEGSTQGSCAYCLDGESYDPPAIANPGNVIQERYTAEEVAALLGIPADVIDCKVGGGQMGSPLAHDNEAPFPERLAEFFVRSFAPEGGTVVDPFAGSGTTPAVAVRWGRRALCCDLRPSQVELTRRRVANEIGLFSGP